MYAPPCSWRTGTNSIEERASDSLRSRVSSPGMPNTCLTPSASRHSTKTSDAFRAAKPCSSLAPSARCKRTLLMDVRNHPAYPGFAPLTPPVMRRTLVATALAAFMCAPASALAATSWTIKGAGWGHGIGMSQYGAYGQAQLGRNYQQILEHYYTGTIVSMSQQRTIRVLLLASRPRATFSGATKIGDRALQPAKTYVARRSGSGLLVKDSRGKRVGRFTTASVSSSQ